MATLATNTFYAYKTYDYGTNGGYGYVDSNGYYGTINITVSQSSNTITVSATFTPRWSGEAINNCRFCAEYNGKYTYGTSLPFSASFTYSNSADKEVMFGFYNEADNIDESIPAAWFLGDDSYSEGDHIQGTVSHTSWNQPPTATITATNVVAGGNANVSWTMSDPDGDDVTVVTSGIGAGLRRYYKASGATSFSSTALTVSSTATSYTDAIPSSYEGGQIYYQLYITDGQDLVYVTSPKYTVAEASNPPTTPSSITVPSSITEGTDISISWGASTDADGDLSGYILQCKLNEGSWTQVYKGTSRSYTYSVPIGTETIVFRVKAYDSKSAESSYKTSSTINVALDPSKLTFIEYIESSGTQYIDTLYIPTNNTRVLLDAQITQGETGEKQLFGLRESTSGPFLTFFLTTDNKISSRWRETAIKTFSSSDTIYERHTFDRNQNTATYDGETLTWEDTEFTFSYTLPLLCRKTGTTIDEHIKAKVYSCQIYENDELVRDFHPAINLNGEAGLYDAVNNKFYKNAGSGTFTVPRLYDSLPSGYILATYVETSGTQYIDTGFIPNSSSRLVMDVYPQYSGTAYEGLFGARPSTNTDAFGVWVRNDGVFLNYNDGTITTYTFSIDPAQRMLIDISPGETTINDTSITTTTTSFDTGNNLVLMAYNTGGTIDTRMANARIYSCQIYNSGSLVRDYLPCVEEATGKIGMFDLQDGIFYPFQGTYTVKAVVEGAINGYVNIGGIHKKILREYENINGVLRLGSDWQTNIDGVLKSSSFEQEYTYDLGAPVYTWKKYTVATSTVYAQSKSSDIQRVQPTVSSRTYYAENYTFDTSTGIYTLTNPTTGIAYDLPDGYYFMTASTSGTAMFECIYSAIGSSSMTVYYYPYTSTSSEVEVKGTYIEDVTSTNASAYPTNGKSGSYWYVKQ